MKRRYYVFIGFLIVLIGLSLYFMTRNLKKSYDASQSYSSELTMKYSREGNTEICTWVNDIGEITWAEDKKYAYEIKTYNDDLVIREDYYDENGNPSYLQAGYCSVVIQESWPVKTFKYLDENGNFIERKDGCAVLIREYISKNSKDYTDRYFDLEMNSVKVHGYNGVAYHFDGDRKVSYTLLDENDNPIDNLSGYATVSRTLFEDNSIKNEMYFNANGDPVCTSDGHYGIGIEYYDSGKKSLVTSLDSNKVPMINSKGYVSVQYFYRDDGTIEKELYLDSKGIPCKAKTGSYGIYYDGDIIYSISKHGIRYLTVNDMLNQFPYLVVIAASVICILFLFLPKKGRIVLCVFYMLFIVFKTILSRETRELDLKLNPIESYRGFFSDTKIALEVINNIWLFVPYGMGIKSIFKNKCILIFLLVLPVIVELIQLIFRVGTFETADIINNVLGELIGILLYMGWSSMKSIKKGSLNKDIQSVN